MFIAASLAYLQPNGKKVVNAATDLTRTTADAYTDTGREIQASGISADKPATVRGSLFFVVAKVTVDP